MVSAQRREKRRAWQAARRELSRRTMPVGCPPRTGAHSCARSGSLTMSRLFRLARQMARSASPASASRPDWCRKTGLSGTALQVRRSEAAGRAMTTTKMRHMPAELGSTIAATMARTFPATKNTCMSTKQDSLTDGGKCSTRREMATGRAPPAPTLVAARRATSVTKFGDAAEARPPSAVSASAARRAGRRPRLSARAPKNRDPRRPAALQTEDFTPQSSVLVPHSLSSST
mmetsp:Transcript_56190/g.112646  ORF Transcript_56190/g.112646 Transcript_56190/m.112646 type:complete len:231 (-) Transcript_56190:328-1020(-)